MRDMPTFDNMQVTGNASIEQDMQVNGNATIGTDMQVNGNETVMQNFNVMGNETIAGSLQVNGSHTVSGNIGAGSTVSALFRMVTQSQPTVPAGGFTSQQVGSIRRSCRASQGLCSRARTVITTCCSLTFRAERLRLR
jgi:predicted acyltransferase (DUF342 family)